MLENEERSLELIVFSQQLVLQTAVALPNLISVFKVMEQVSLADTAVFLAVFFFQRHDNVWADAGFLNRPAAGRAVAGRGQAQPSSIW